MDYRKKTYDKIQQKDAAARMVRGWQASGQTVVFSNGCFDLLHPGHVDYLAGARNLGDRLVIGLNSDASVRRLKGSGRPVNDEHFRSVLLAAMAFVDMVVLFEEDTPLQLITLLQPDVLVKGSDYAVHEIVGAEVVLARGGKVETLDFIEGYSTSRLIEKIKGNR